MPARLSCESEKRPGSQWSPARTRTNLVGVDRHLAHHQPSNSNAKQSSDVQEDSDPRPGSGFDQNTSKTAVNDLNDDRDDHEAENGPATTRITKRRTSAELRSVAARSRRSGNFNWKPALSRDASPEQEPDLISSPSHETTVANPPRTTGDAIDGLSSTSPMMEKLSIESRGRRGPSTKTYRSRSPWYTSMRTLMVTLAGLFCLGLIVHSLNTRQLDPKGCRMAWMHPSYHQLDEFDTEHTRFASKYSLYLYRDAGIDRDTKLRGIPVLFIPGNAGSYRQVRSIASEAATYYRDVVRHDERALRRGARPLDFFSVDFNEDFTAFHGRTLLDQAEYLNEAVRYILSLYLDPRKSERESGVPDPTSVIVIGHSMGGVVARTMLTMANYQANSINTILTMSAPHARAPVSFDGLMVRTYREINDYWRHAFLKPSRENPLEQVTLVSVAGGGLDTIVPSDYASIESLVPGTNGFTVYTSSIPTVWTSMDHQAIMWCDQFRKVVSRALYDIVDIRRPSQTKGRSERMRKLKRWFLTGMESNTERDSAHAAASTLLILDDTSNDITRQGERFVLRGLGSKPGGKGRAYLLPIPPPNSPAGKQLNILTDQRLGNSGDSSLIEVMFCSMSASSQQGQASATSFSTKMDLSEGDSTSSTRLACKNAAPDVIQLPRSTRSTRYPFYLDGEQELLPFSYLHYDVDEIASEYQFVAIVDKSSDPTSGFLISEFNDLSQSHSVQRIGLKHLLTTGLELEMPSDRPMVTEVKIPLMRSSLLAYNLEISKKACQGKSSEELFTPLVRQYLTEPYESKFYVNVSRASISLHGVAPYVPPAMRPRVDGEDGLSLQFWTDPTCGASVRVKLTVDFIGSMGKLYMRYRTIFACFPLLVAALVLRKQFNVYDETGVFIPFTQGLDLALRRSIPLLLAGLTIASIVMGEREAYSSASPLSESHHQKNTTHPTAIDFDQNDLLIGTRDIFFWFMVPLIGLVSIGACAALNYSFLALSQLLSFLFGLLKVRFAWRNRHDGYRNGSASPSSTKTSFRVCSPRRRVITTLILLFFVATFVPYQFAYVVCCVVQLTTTVRALRITSDAQRPPSSSSATSSEKSATNSTNLHNLNFYNYVHSILVLMIWVMPIDVPVLLVWVRNLALNWMTPFSSHHNVLSIIPFIVLVETHTTGKMVPRVTSRPLRHVSGIILTGTAVYAAIYGVSYAYVLHHLVNIFAAWLVAVHLTTAAAAVAGSSNGGGFASFSSSSYTISSVSSLFENGQVIDQKGGKIP
ncbi:GPI inositol-deacylase [Pyricularia oryzae]|nr:GPI inositol-deacylase [Pyricularia oryzae]